MKNHLVACFASLALAHLGAMAQSALPHAVPGEKLDSGLGSLPHYSKWADPSGRVAARPRVEGESLDDGLGALPPYSQWKDKTGRDPMGQLAASVRVARR